MTSFATLLRSYRLRAGRTQKGLAIAAGMVASAINRMESGERGPSRETVFTLADHLGLGALDTDRLLLSAGYAPRDPLALTIDACRRLSEASGTPTAVARHAWATGQALGGLVAALAATDTDLMRVVTCCEGMAEVGV